MIQVKTFRRVCSVVASGLLFGCTQFNPTTENEGTASGWSEDGLPAYDWSEQEIREAVNTARAGRSLQPMVWPEGGKVAVSFSFDVDNETISLRNGDTSVGALSQGEYGGRVALARVLDVLASDGIPASFFIPSVSMMLNPGMVEAIKSHGIHEFGIHGWIHESNNQLPEDVERRLVVQAVDYMEAMTGSRPVGYRAPSWNFSQNTLKIIQDLGFLYDSSLMADDRPYELLAGGEPSGLVELPVEWILDDAPLLNPRGNSYSPPREVLQVFKDEFDVAYEEGTMFLLTMHPHVIGHRSRILVLKELIDYIKDKDENIWFATHQQIAEYVIQMAEEGKLR
jgi:peptidoglycan/xylan/chitin deacetylase (PgdA/CDA1 family)